MNTKDNGFPPKVQELAYEFKVKDAMSQNVIAVTSSDTMAEVRRLLLENRISGLPVVDSKEPAGGLVGIISLDNLIACIMEGGMDAAVSDHMTVDVVSLYADEPLIHAISQFENLGYGRFPVLDRDTKKPVGILTKGDIIRCLLKKLETNYHQEELHKYRASHLFQDINSDQTRLILRHHITGGNHKHAGEQSGYLKTNLLRLGIPPQIVRRIVIASCEAEMNIIIFTEGGDITACVEKEKITLNAIDHGPGIPDIDKAMQPGYSTAPDWVREMGFGAGMGLPNMKSCSDKMRIETTPEKGTNVELLFYMPT